jgi:hypothetical protein
MSEKWITHGGMVYHCAINAIVNVAGGNFSIRALKMIPFLVSFGYG